MQADRRERRTRGQGTMHEGAAQRHPLLPARRKDLQRTRRNGEIRTLILSRQRRAGSGTPLFLEAGIKEVCQPFI